MIVSLLGLLSREKVGNLIQEELCSVLSSSMDLDLSIDTLNSYTDLTRPLLKNQDDAGDNSDSVKEIKMKEEAATSNENLEKEIVEIRLAFNEDSSRNFQIFTDL